MEGIGCHSITEHRKEYRAALPNDTDNTKVSVNKDTLGGRIYTSGEIVRGDIITVVMDITDNDFRSALRLMHDILGLPFVMKLSPRKKYNPLNIFEIGRASCRERV